MQLNFGFPSEKFWWLPQAASSPLPPLTPLATVSGKVKRQPRCSRRIKPPYSYTELITQAIQASPKRTVTLREIVAYMQAQFPCFRGEYQGWRNSVRHNLSASECFRKILRDPSKPNGKDNFWTLNEDCDHCLGRRESKGPSRVPKTEKTTTGKATDDTEGSQKTPRPPVSYREEGAEALSPFTYPYGGCQDSPGDLVIDESTPDINNNNGTVADKMDATYSPYGGDTINNNDLLSNNKSVISGVRASVDENCSDVCGDGSDVVGNDLILTNSKSALAKNENSAIHPVRISTAEETTGWSRMAVGNVEDLLFLSSNPEPTRYYPQQPQEWGPNFLPNYGRPYGDHEQFVYPYRPVPQPQPPYLAPPEAVYQNRFCFAPYNVTNPGFANFAVMDQRRDLSSQLSVPHHQLSPQLQPPMTPSEEFSDGLSCGQTPSPVSEGAWEPTADQPIDNAVYQQI